VIRKFKKGYRAEKIAKEKSREKNIFYFEGDRRIFFPLIGGEEKPKTEEKPEERGIDLKISEIQKPLQSPLTTEEKEILTRINIKYPLIPRFPKPNEKVFAYAHLVWDPKKNSVVYNVVEPVISQKERDVIEDIKRELEERLDVDFLKIGKIRYFLKGVLIQEERKFYDII
jgi:hypothetical protein